MKQGIETIVGDGIGRFTQDQVGCRPKHIDTKLLGDLMVVRLEGALPTLRQQLIKQAWTELIEPRKTKLLALIEQAAGAKVLNLNHDINSATGEAIVVCTLVEAALPAASTIAVHSVMSNKTAGS
jgi:uncharacterized protein YbcI